MSLKIAPLYSSTVFGDPLKPKSVLEVLTRYHKDLVTPSSGRRERKEHRREGGHRLLWTWLSAHASRRVTLRHPGVRLWVCSTNDINNFTEHSGEARGRVARGTHGDRRWSPWGFLFLQRDEAEVAGLAGWRRQAVSGLGNSVSWAGL